MEIILKEMLYYRVLHRTFPMLSVLSFLKKEEWSDVEHYKRALLCAIVSLIICQSGPYLQDNTEKFKNVLSMLKYSFAPSSECNSSHCIILKNPLKKSEEGVGLRRGGLRRGVVGRGGAWMHAYV